MGRGGREHVIIKDEICFPFSVLVDLVFLFIINTYHTDTVVIFNCGGRRSWQAGG